MGSLSEGMKGREREWGGMWRVGLIGLLRGRGCEYLSALYWGCRWREGLSVEGSCCGIGSYANCVCLQFGID